MDGRRTGLNRTWHLAENAHEIAITEMEFALLRVGEAFQRWQSECLAMVAEKQFSGQDNTILHVIRMHERPKGVTEIARLLNRDDIANVQYSVRKLLSAKLIERSSKGGPKNATYQVTVTGKQATDEYAMLRRSLLISLTRSVAGGDSTFHESTRTLELMTGIYDQAARVAATHRTSGEH